MSAANGKTGSPEELASSFYDFALTQRDPQLIMAAQTMRQAATERAAYNASRQPPKISPVGPAPGALGSGSFGMDQNTLGSGAFDFGQQSAPVLQPNVPGTAVSTPVRPMATPAAPMVNQLAPASAAPAAPVNQLADNTAALRAEYAKLSEFSDLPGVKDRMDLIKAQFTESGKLYTVGGNLVTGTGQPIFTAPKEVTESEFERNLAKSGLPEDQKTAFRIARARKETTFAPAAVVNVSNVQEKAEAADFGKLLVKDYDSVKAAANLAQKSIPALESNLAILNKGFDTGSFTESKVAAAKVLGALGVKDAEKYAADSQAFLANASAAVLQRQLEQKGPQTEADAQRITQTGAQLGNTKAANEFVLKVAKSQLQRDIEQRDFYANWRDKNQTFNGAENAWFTGPGSKSLFERPELKAYAAGPNVKELAKSRTEGLDKIFGGKR
jgi:hypothetical protein